MAKNADIDKYGYSGYGRPSFSHPSSGDGYDVIIFGVDMSSSTKIDNRKRKYFNAWKRSNAGFKTYNKC